MVGSGFVRRLYWRAIWLVGIHSLGLFMLPDATDRELRQEGFRQSSYDGVRRE
jgi:hypothetical protein